MKFFPRYSLRFFFAIRILGLVSLQAQEGPTPYPASEADWPGKGPVRVFPWFKDNRDHFWKTRAEKQGAIVLAGDSLIANWKTLESDFPGLKIANRGIGGDGSRGLLFRFQEDVLDLHPKAVVILIGTNDLSAFGSPDDILSNLSIIWEMARKQDKDLPLIVCTTLPRNHPKAPTQPGKQQELNTKIKGWVEGREKTRVLDLYPVFLLEDGNQDITLFNPDQLHLSAAGYTKFRDALNPILEEFKDK